MEKHSLKSHDSEASSVGGGLMKTAFTIGSGIAGLASAIRLAAKGFQVTVFEKNSYPGGKLSWFQKEGYSFDAGPSLFTQPQLIEELFELAGEPITAYFQYEKLPVSCTYFFENGKKVIAYTDRKKLTAELEEKLGELPKNVEQYLNKSEKLYNNVGPLFLDNSLHKRKTFFKKQVPNAIATSRLGHVFRSLNQHNQAHFTSPEAVQIFNRFATYNGSNPYKAPAMLGMIPHLEMNEGTFYPKGGMVSITNALFELAKKMGIRFQFNTPVERIIHTEGKVQGIVVNGENLFADVVVSNVDVYFTYKNLLNDSIKSTQLLKQERSSSALIFYWGIRKTFPQLGLHNIFFSNNYRKEFTHLFQSKDFSNDITVYINITSKLESTQAPPGCENWFVMINAPSIAKQDWKAMQQTVRRQVIDKLNRMLQTNLESLIETETVMSPPEIESVTASYAGSLYGTSSNSRLAAFWRHPNFSRRIAGLYFAGGSVHPGGGIPLCLRSAKIMSEMVQNSFSNHSKEVAKFHKV